MPKNSKAVSIITGSALALALAFLGTAGANAASDAGTSINSKANPINGLVTAIAQKFNINAADVQQVFDEQRLAEETARKQARDFGSANFLREAVASGKLTQAQSDAIAAKRAELTASMKANFSQSKIDFKAMTDTERKAAMGSEKAKREAAMTSLKTWATNNNIPSEFIPFLGERHGSRGGPGFGSPGRDSLKRPAAQTTLTQ